jgi:transcription termination factor Rho
MRRAMNGMKGEDAVERILDMFARTRNNEELIQRVKHSHVV